MLHLLQLRLQVELALLQSFEHGPRDVLALRPEHFEALLHRVKLRLQDALLQLRRLGYLTELVVRHDDAVVVVVLDVVEETHAVGGGEVLLGGIEDAGVGIGRLIGGGYLRHISFQSDNHRLVGEAQPFHLVRRHAHYQRLARSHLMVAYPAAVLLEHPHTVLLRGIDVLHTTACQPLEVEVGEGLVRAVVLRTHETVELAVVHRHKPFLELRRLLFEPFGEAVTYLVNLGVGELYALGIAHLDVVAVLVLTDALHHVGTGVVQGVLQQAHAVVVAVVALHAELVPNLDVLAVAHGGELVHAGGISDADIGLVEVAHVGGVDARGYPPFAEVEVEFLEGDALRGGILQCL